MPGLHIVQASSESWPEGGAQAERAWNTGWAYDQIIGSTGQLTTNAGPSTASAFLSTGDGTTGSGNSFYAIGRRLRVVSGAASTVTTYGEVSTAAYSTTTLQTTVTITRITSGTTALSTGGIGSVGAGSVFASTDWNTPFPFRWGSWALSTDGNLLGEADNTYDIASAATRVRTGYFATGIRLGTSPGTGGVIGVANNTLAISGRNALNNGDIDIIGIGSDNRVYIGGHFATGAPAISMSSTVLFETDNSNDIGASGATRARRLFLAGFLELGGAGSTNNQFSTASTGAGSTTMYIGNASINVTSDRRTKTAIVPTERDALALVRSLPVVDFAWDDPSDTAIINRNSRGRWTGFVAQDLVDIVPWVINAPDRNCGDCRAGRNCSRHEGYWRVEHEHLVPLLARAIQQLDARIDTLAMRTA